MLELPPPLLTQSGYDDQVKFICFRSLADVFGLLIKELLYRSAGISETICLFGTNRPINHLMAKFLD